MKINSAQTGAAPFFFNLMSQNQLASNAFSVHLSRQSDPNNTSEVSRFPRRPTIWVLRKTVPKMCLGCIDSSRFQGSEWTSNTTGTGTEHMSGSGLVYFPLQPEVPGQPQQYWTVGVSEDDQLSSAFSGPYSGPRTPSFRSTEYRLPILSMLSWIPEAALYDVCRLCSASALNVLCF